MQISFKHNKATYVANLGQPIDISIPLKNEATLGGTNEVHKPLNPNCFFAPPPQFVPVQTESFIGDTTQGGSVNFYNVKLNPHGNGTHTECVGHIAKERYNINDCLKQFHSIGLLITITPEENQGDLIITKPLVEAQLKTANHEVATLIIRTLPNHISKLTQNYSGTNPAYFTTEAMQYIVSFGVEHLLVDLPSIDKEADGGQMAAHHIFWDYPTATRKNATISEMVFIPNEIPDAMYLVNHQIMSIELDSSPSKILLYKLYDDETN
jgi:arylformamidase